VRINVGIDGVKLGQSQAAVRAAAGRPGRIVRDINDFGPYTEFFYGPAKLRVVFQGDEAVSSITTTGLGDRTVTGVGVGSSEAQLRAGLRGERCEAAGPGRRICTVGTHGIGLRVTTFRLWARHVYSVSVGVLLD
jgi:hypothetical protein